MTKKSMTKRTMTKRNWRVSTLMAAIAALGLTSDVLPAATAEPINIVLVHGVLMDGSTWRGVYGADQGRLSRDGGAATPDQSRR